MHALCVYFVDNGGFLWRPFCYDGSCGGGRKIEKIIKINTLLITPIIKGNNSNYFDLKKIIVLGFLMNKYFYYYF